MRSRPDDLFATPPRVGETVALLLGSHLDDEATRRVVAARVVRVTKTRIIIAGGNRAEFRRRDGMRAPRSHRWDIRPWTDELRRRAEENERRERERLERWRKEVRA